jgi:GT2 family glycosyltransferase
MRVGVIVTSRNDVRLLRALQSLREQSLRPSEIVVADGSDDNWLQSHAELTERCVELGATWVHSERASVPKARNMGIRKLAHLDVIAFLDTDEYAPSVWLEVLTAPILRKEADFTGGPTRPAGESHRYAEYLNTIEERHYRWVARDISQLPMGNSAWRREVFDAIGGFDESFLLAGEDYDVNLRALDAGFRGLFVPEAWVYHDQSHLNTAWKILKRKYRYNIGGAMAYIKNRALAERVSRIVSRPKYWHWLELFNPTIRLLAYLRARSLME